MPLLLLVLLVALAAVGAAVGVVVAVRAGGGGTTALRAPEGEQGLLRISAEVRTGWEQTLVGLIRELRLPRDLEGVAYGALYLEQRSEHRMAVRTRSEIGRGFLGAIDIEPRRGSTAVTYAILRLPGDEDLHARVLDLELDLISALRRIDADASIHLAADALRELGRQRRRS